MVGTGSGTASSSSGNSRGVSRGKVPCGCPEGNGFAVGLRCASSGWPLAELSNSFGATGPPVVLADPLPAVGAAHGYSGSHIPRPFTCGLYFKRSPEHDSMIGPSLEQPLALAILFPGEIRLTTPEITYARGRHHQARRPRGPPVDGGSRH